MNGCRAARNRFLVTMPVTCFRFLLFCSAWWLPGLVDAELNFTHNLIHGDDENGFALPDEDVTIQCTFKDDQFGSYIIIDSPGIFGCLACSVGDVQGSPECNGKVDPHCALEEGFLNATLVVFGGGNQFGKYTCGYNTHSKQLTISQRVPVKSIEVGLADNETSIITQGGTLTLECRTNCPVAPEPQFAWSGQTQSDNITAVELPCINQTQHTVAGSQLTIGWQQIKDPTNIITYECCETGENLCDTLDITHAAGLSPTSTMSHSTTTSEPNVPHIPAPRSCSTGCIAGAACAACAGLVTVIVILVCCCHERCPCYTWCRQPKPVATLSPATQMYNRPVNDAAPTSEIKYA